MNTLTACSALALLSASALLAQSAVPPSRPLNVQDVQPCEALDPNTVYNDVDDPAAHTHLNTVEVNHFPPQVERLERGLTAPLPRDIAFVLRQFPNHRRALNSMAIWQLKNQLPTDPDAHVWSADCYFQRAIAFRPEDWQVYFIYGIYLHRTHRLEGAANAYDSAEQRGASGADYYYNRGLLEVDRGNLDNAQEYADKAYELGHPLPGLRHKLEQARVGHPKPQPSAAQSRKR